MGINRNYGRVVDGAIEYAPANLRIGDTIYASPTAEQYAGVHYYPIYADEPPTVREGFEWVFTRWEERDGGIHKVYEERAVTPGPILVSKSKVETIVDRMGKTAAFVAWLNSKATYFGAWLRGGDEIAYDPTDNSSDLASLVVALGIPAEGIGELIAEARAE